MTAVEEVKALASTQQVQFMKLDLADLESVKVGTLELSPLENYYLFLNARVSQTFAAEYQKKFSRLDILINNAGVMVCPQTLYVTLFCCYCNNN